MSVLQEKNRDLTIPMPTGKFDDMYEQIFGDTPASNKLKDKEEAEKATSEELRIDPTYGPAGLISAVVLGYFFL